VFVRGQVGQDLDSAMNVGIGDAAAQAEQAMHNVRQLLGEAGAGLEHICKITIYLTDPRYREPVYRTIGRCSRACTRCPPASSSRDLRDPSGWSRWMSSPSSRSRRACVTFSIAARSPDAALFGIAIASSSPAVAARCAHARAGAGAVATQNITTRRWVRASWTLLRAVRRRLWRCAKALAATPSVPIGNCWSWRARGPAGPLG